MHHSVQGASSLGKIFGFEFGLIGGQEACPKTNDIIKRSGGTEVSNLYHAGLLGAVSVPFGLTAEAILIPKTSANSADFQMSSLALKWTMNQELLSFIPFNLALRGVYTTSKFSFTQVISGTDATVENTNTVTGLQILASPALPLIEPYAGIGFLNATNKLAVTGTSGTIFNSSFTTAQSSENSPKSTQFLLGVNANLLFVRLGLEYSNAFDATAYTAKLAFGF